MTSRHYVTSGRLRFRFVQVFFNAVALLIIAGGLTIYFKSYPETLIRVENKTIYTNVVAFTERVSTAIEEKNPAPGVCLPIIVTFCTYHKIPYNFTIFPNYMGDFGQLDAQHELEPYGAVIDVKCYELAALFLCSVFVPKCGSRGHVVRPCRSLCFHTKRRCGFFLDVFGLSLPEYLECDLFPENSNPDECVGQQEVLEAARKAERPENKKKEREISEMKRKNRECTRGEQEETIVLRFLVNALNTVCTSGFQCDGTRCIPVDWRCDGHLDCADHTDETECGECTVSSSSSSSSSINSTKIMKKPILAMNTISKSALHCGQRRCMSASHICNGEMDCPWGQDERYCYLSFKLSTDISVRTVNDFPNTPTVRLSQRNGDVGEGRLEVYHAEMGKFMPACIPYWDSSTAETICSMLGYT
ncbi:hypothetical protein K0M31_004624 [Melipona bicolor]|uniref:Atrial natriuretic peptide-converting enzyme n=1 Tax=Melipona bicolor TaxID=60889 RepID=A0AA40KNR7_9HYME|nr:hypothetical protein K0M31_004624 [Melipona bicolor]